MIDSIKFSTSGYDHGDAVDITLAGETLLAAADQDWAVLVEGKKGSLSLDSGEDLDSWTVGIGFKYYVTKTTSVALKGSYTEIDYADDIEIRTGTFELKQRIAPSDADISPFVWGSASINETDSAIGYLSSDGDDYAEFVLSGGIGSEFMMNEAMAIIVDISYSQSEALSSDANDSYDGWTAGIALACYWE